VNKNFIKYNVSDEKELLQKLYLHEQLPIKNTYNRLQCTANMDSRKLSEKEHAVELGWSRIYDAGQRFYSLKIDKLENK
jgi:hypothetical protein